MKPKELKQISLLTDVASLYYEKNFTQSEVADKLFLSRTRISRLLKQAREKGIVEIRINNLLSRNYELEDVLKERFQLKEVYLLNSRGKSEAEIHRETSALAADYLKQRFKKKLSLGVSWGSTIAEAVNALSQSKSINRSIPIDIVQIMGTASVNNPNSTSHDIMNRLTEIYSGKAHYLSAPLFIENDFVRETIIKDPTISKALETARNVDLILTGIGTLNDARSTNPWLGYLNKDTYNELKQKAAVGCICAQFYDLEGQEIQTSWNKQCIGINLNQLKRIEEVIAVAHGIEKAKAILGAIRGKYISVLITDSETAHQLMTY
jgi:deoxyribonucleoside regulator